MTDWSYFRHPDGAINLEAVFYEKYSTDLNRLPCVGDAIDYLDDVQNIQRIKSRQCAAIAIRTAYEIARKP